MRSTLLTLTIAATSLLLFPSGNAAAQDKAVHGEVKCGPESWRRNSCATCTWKGKTYTVTKYVEGAMSVATDGMKDLPDPKKYIDTIGETVGAKYAKEKRWTEQGSKSPEINWTFCWDSVKAEEIKPLKDKNYGLGMFYDDTCRIEADRCYQVVTECRKARDEKGFNCTHSLQEFMEKDGKCDDSPRKDTCNCTPDGKYWYCGKVADKAPKAGKKGKRR